MKSIYFIPLLALIFVACTSPIKKGKVEVLKTFPSNFVQSRNVEIYTPPGYNPKISYPVLYMHDGQNVFHPETSTHQIDWGVDEAMDSLVNGGIIEPMIVVASWCVPEIRWNEYMPNILSTEEIVKYPFGFMNKLNDSALLSDQYLKFIVTELKPFIDSAYSTKSDAENTYIMGSSMGGLISLYALNSYPGVFSRAACLSTHWHAFDGLYIETLKSTLPKAGKHAIYFDFGTATLDSLYEPYQLRVDSLMQQKGICKIKIG
jgi:predicted alpha/beta superfamily hydrolase